ncbi:hypothetical protein SL180013_24300 [Salmonella enterica subsp. enterica serovar Senftenberg]|nr:hypothetical protein SL180013_24300 [Salmonella enterica subsp. enterica serovar Senftenberg]
MSDDSIIKNSSMLLAYLGGLGWGSAYFYGWGVSAYYGFPWWYVGVGPDNIARSLFHAISLMAIFIIAWGVGILLFFLVKQKARIHDLREGANKQVISSQVDSLIKISRIWADFFPANTSNQPI